MSCATAGNLTVCRSRDRAAPLHEATLTVDLDDGEVRVFRPVTSPYALARCHRCNRRRRARNLLAIHDAWRGSLIWCADGCAAWRKRRNAAARRRYAQRRAAERAGSSRSRGGAAAR